MKKKIVKKLNEEKINTDNLKKLKPLLKGIKVKSKDVVIDQSFSPWPASAKLEDGSVLKFGVYNLGHISNQGFYYCEYQPEFEDKKDRVYLSHYSYLKVKELLLNDEEAYIQPHSFNQLGIRPDFEVDMDYEKAIDKDKNFIDIINKKMKKSQKEAKKLIKQLKNQK